MKRNIKKQYKIGKRLSSLILSLVMIVGTVMPSMPVVAAGGYSGDVNLYRSSSLTKLLGTLPNTVAGYKEVDGGAAWTIDEKIFTNPKYPEGQVYVVTDRQKAYLYDNNKLPNIWGKQNSITAVNIKNLQGVDVSGTVYADWEDMHNHGVYGRSYTIKDEEGQFIYLTESDGKTLKKSGSDYVKNPNSGYHIYESLRKGKVDILGWECAHATAFAVGYHYLFKKCNKNHPQLIH